MYCEKEKRVSTFCYFALCFFCCFCGDGGDSGLELCEKRRAKKCLAKGCLNR